MFFIMPIHAQQVTPLFTFQGIPYTQFLLHFHKFISEFFFFFHISFSLVFLEWRGSIFLKTMNKEDFLFNSLFIFSFHHTHNLAFLPKFDVQ